MAEQEDGSSITVFVKGISFQIDDKQFEEAFADVGPIRTVFLVRKKGQDRHLGYGFVTYALLDDAKRAVEEMDGKQISGRAVQVSFAKRRAPLDERRLRDQEGQPDGEAKPVEKAPTPRIKPAKTPMPEGTDKHKFVRTLALGGLTEGNRKAAMKKARKAGKVEEVIDPAPEDILQQFHVLRDGCPTGRALLVFEKAKGCTAAVAGLHRATLPGGDTIWARQLSGEGLHLKKWRVIVRNLPFGTTAEQLRDAMQAAGFVWDLNLPKRDDGKAKGFGFVTYTCKAHAEEAISTINGTKIAGRMVAVDWALAKGAYDQASAAAASEAAESQSDDDDDEGSESDEDDESKMSDDESDEEELEDESDDGKENSSEDTGGQAEAADSAKLEKERKSTLSLLDKMLEKEEEGSTDAAQKSAQGAKKGGKPQAKENKASLDQEGKTASKQSGKDKVPQAGQINGTVFVRGLHLDVTKMDLQLKMERFGAVKSCRLVVDKDTKKLKGTAFVDFETPKAAEKAVAACGKDKAKGITINGIAVQVNHALTQDGARALATQRSEAVGGKSKDKRNLHLAKEGTIERNSVAWESMSQTDKAKRERATEERNAKLKNPNMYCSTTRLLIRNVPKDMDDKGLQELCVKMVKERATKSKPAVKSCKILMDGGDGNAGPRSRGRGFIEFDNPENALNCLRQMNNNPKAFKTTSSRPIVEFAVEDARLKRKFELKSRARQNIQDGENVSPAAKKMEKKKRWKQLLRDKIAGRKEAKEAKGGNESNAEAGHGGSSKGRKKHNAQAEPDESSATRKDRGPRHPQDRKPQADEGHGKGKPRTKKRAPGSDSMTAAEAFKAAKAKRVKANAAMEEVHASRKRKQDQAMDILAQEGSTTIYQDRKQKKQKKKKEATDKLDDLVGQYRKKLFGSTASKQAGANGEISRNKSRLKKWFE